MGTFGFTAEDAKALIAKAEQERIDAFYQDMIGRIKTAASEGYGSIDIEVANIEAIQDYEQLTKVLNRLRKDGFIITLTPKIITIEWNPSPSGSPSGSEQ